MSRFSGRLGWSRSGNKNFRLAQICKTSRNMGMKESNVTWQDYPDCRFSGSGWLRCFQELCRTQAPLEAATWD